MRTFFFVLVLVCFVLGGARIEFLPEREIDIGTVLRDSVSSEIIFDFTLKNLGIEPLVLKKVKSTCGCTVVDYDKIISPGKSGKLKATIKKSRINDGYFSKAIKIYSNATNDSVATLFLKGRIVSYITSSLHYIRLVANDDEPVKYFLHLSTPMKNLKVNSLSFISNDEYSSSVDGDFSLVSNGKDSYGYNIYTLNFSFDVHPVDYLKGMFIIKTNCSKMETIKIRGMIVPSNY